MENAITTLIYSKIPKYQELKVLKMIMDSLINCIIILLTEYSEVCFFSAI
jgi:hypothetical protein